ncbi:unnamed protein product [Jaminaea pallidilutea]
MQSYIPAVRRWGRSDALLISFRGLEDTVTGQTVSFPSNTVSVPYDFVKGAGYAEAALLEEIAQQCVNEEGDLLANNGQPAKTVAAGEQFVFAPADDDGFTWAQGPEGKSAALQPGSDDSENTSSSEVDQMYRDVLGPTSEAELYDVSAGFLVRDDLHKAYDRHEWSWFCRDDKYYVHYFAPQCQADRDLHGKCIDPATRWHVEPEEYMDVKLAAWHYQQTVLMRIRGFAAGER